MAQAPVRETPAPTAVKTRTRFGDFRQAFLGNKLAIVGLVVITLFVLMAVFAPLLAPYDPIKDQSLGDRFAGPSASHPLGQDELGRDILSRIIFGARVSLTAGLAAVAFATAFGTLVGVVAGYAVGVVLLPQIARVVRSSVISIRERDYVEAERAIGASDVQIVSAAILPNSMAPLIVQSTLALATAILDVAALSFLGLGAQPPQPEWGAMLTDAFRSGFGVFTEGQHAIIFPGIAIALSVLAVNFIGDGLRDALDPRRR